MSRMTEGEVQALCAAQGAEEAFCRLRFTAGKVAHYLRRYRIFGLAQDLEQAMKLARYIEDPEAWQYHLREVAR